MLDNISSRRIESDRMERRNNEPLFDSVNSEMAKNIEWWHGHPYSSETAGEINTLIRLARSAGYGITLTVDGEGWNREASQKDISSRHWTEKDVEVLEIDTPKDQGDKGARLHAHVHNPVNPLDEYTSSSAFFMIEFSDGSDISFKPSEIKSIQILKYRTFGTPKEVKDTFWPDVSDDEFFGKIDSGDMSEALKEIINRSTRGN